jgi:hypothetical protein
MSRGNRLSATVREQHREKINNIAEERGIDDVEAERAVMRAGLIRLGYLNDNSDRGEKFLRLTRKVGVTLGGAGLAATTFGLFGWTVMQAIGFGLVLSGFAAIAGAEFAPAIDSRIQSVRGEST